MKSNKELIMEYTGVMSFKVIREKLEMLYVEQKKLEWDIHEGLPASHYTEIGRAQHSKRHTIKSEINRLCNMASDRRYGKMTIPEIEKKWKNSERDEREEMQRFLPDIDAQVDWIEIGTKAEPWACHPIYLDDEFNANLMSKFARHTKCKSKKAMEVVI